ncbi:hypothetical protein A2635_01770 [Candidatus Peribacteria bacterium RIFCSPHIGHO2_01_FULL_51_9]|nr:MAG: hypothetical protein A2635_01770 [Candidatus Peribacteria bacterium RIFCSPHIGHO2_01_FULL_51_9]
MLLIRAIFCIGFATCFAIPAHAAQLTEWSFLDGEIPGRWEVSDIKPNPTPSPQGLQIKTVSEGTMTQRMRLSHGIDSIVLRASAPVDTEAKLLWHQRNTPDGTMVEFPFVIPGGGIPVKIEFNVAPYPQWDPWTDQMGFVFPSQAELTIHTIQFVGFALWEKAIEGWRSFWDFDRYTPYSINFVWGPLMTFNPIARRYLYTTLPPLAHSWNWVFYGAIAGAAFFLLLHYVRHRSPRTASRNCILFFSLFFSLWIFYDIRMGSEWIHHFVTIYRDYWTAPLEERTFREHKRFYDFVEAAIPYIQQQDKYIFIGQYRWPYLGAIRYLTFPAIPTFPEQATFGIRTWVVFDRPDITLNEQNRLMMEGKSVTEPGELLLKFDEGSFVFRTSTQQSR